MAPPVAWQGRGWRHPARPRQRTRVPSSRCAVGAVGFKNTPSDRETLPAVSAPWCRAAGHLLAALQSQGDGAAGVGRSWPQAPRSREPGGAQEHPALPEARPFSGRAWRVFRVGAAPAVCPEAPGSGHRLRREPGARPSSRVSPGLGSAAEPGSRGAEGRVCRRLQRAARALGRASGKDREGWL